MIPLAVDGFIALVKFLDRGLSAVEDVCRRPSPRVVDGARPAAGPPPAGGGHSPRTTSQVLGHAARELDFAFPGGQPAVIRELIAELRDHAAQLAAHNL